jgi:hypothetical protein
MFCSIQWLCTLAFISHVKDDSVRAFPLVGEITRSLSLFSLVPYPNPAVGLYNESIS